MQDAPACNAHVRLSKDKCVSSTVFNSPISTKESLSPPLKSKLQEVFL
jgi:hypothetical protein